MRPALGFQHNIMCIPTHAILTIRSFVRESEIQFKKNIIFRDTYMFWEKQIKRYENSRRAKQKSDLNKKITENIYQEITHL